MGSNYLFYVIVRLVLCWTYSHILAPIEMTQKVLAASSGLLAPYMNKGHIMYTDSYYTSPELSAFLYSKGVGLCGTVHKNNKHLPPTFQDKENQAWCLLRPEVGEGLGNAVT